MIAKLLCHQLGSALVWPHPQQPNTVQHQHPGPVDPVGQYSQDPWICLPDLNQTPSIELQ